MIVLNARLEMPTWLRRSAWNALLKAGYHDLGAWVHDTIMAKHFTHAGAREYRYRKRAPGYTRRKRRRFGHDLPLVYTGETRARVLAPAGQWTRISATARGCTLRFSVPRLNRRRLHAELTAVSRRDARAMARRLTDYIHGRLERWGRMFRLSA